MFNWLSPRSTSYRRAARPASEASFAVAPIEPVGEVPATPVAVIDDETPPPFFADADPAFLDLNDPAPDLTDVGPIAEPDFDAEARLARALAALPPFPEVGTVDRTERLLEILRSLDRIAGDVCNALEADREPSDPLPVERIPR